MNLRRIACARKEVKIVYPSLLQYSRREIHDLPVFEAKRAKLLVSHLRGVLDLSCVEARAQPLLVPQRLLPAKSR